MSFMGRARTRFGWTAAPLGRELGFPSWETTAGRWGRRFSIGSARGRIDLRAPRPGAGELRSRLPVPELPFEFQCGFAGWLGYELKAECGGEAAHESSLPDAAFVFAGRMIAFDHAERRTYLLALAERGGEVEAERWLAATARRLESLPHRAWRGAFLARMSTENGTADAMRGRCRRWAALARPRERYLEEIAECRRLLAEGETYEVCLTNAIAVDRMAPRPAGALPALRRVNPAPFSVLHPLRRRRGAQLLARALPARRPRPPGRGEADQGDEPPRGEPGRGRAARRAAAQRREEPGREPDDRRPAAQRPRLGLRGRHRARALADAGRDLRDRAPARHHGARPAARGARPARLRARLLPARLDDGGAEAPHDADPRPARGRRARPLLRGDRLASASAAPATSASRSARSSSTATRRGSAPAARSSPSPTPRRSTRRCCSRRARRCARSSRLRISHRK